MRRPGAMAIMLVAAALTGCNSKQVQMYAGRLEGLLADYKQGVQARVDAERKLYNELSATLAAEAERDVYEGLKVERLRQQRILTGDLADGRAAPSQAIERMRETALGEFDRTRAWFEREMTVHQQYQAGLAQVTLDAKKIDALDAALQAVQEDPGLKKALGDVVAFGGAFKEEFGLASCKDLERERASRNETIEDLKAEMAAAEASKDAEQAAALKRRVDALAGAQAAVQTKLDANSHFQAAGGAGKKCQ